MIITESQLRRIIREELVRVNGAQPNKLLREQQIVRPEPADVMGFKSKEDVQAYINNIDSMLAPGGIYDANFEWAPGRKIGENSVTRVAFKNLKTVLENALRGINTGSYQPTQAMKNWKMTKNDSAVSKITPEEFDKVIKFLEVVLWKATTNQPVFNF
jgi:hypothetical protein